MDALEELIGPGPRAAKTGDNQPPDLATALQQELEEESRALLERKTQLLDAFERAPLAVEDEEWEKKIADVVRLITQCTRAAEDKRTAKKEPYLAGGRAVDAFYKNKIVDPLEKAKSTLQQRLTVWQRKKAEEARRAAEIEARRASEEAERLRQETLARERAMKTESDMAAAITSGELARQAEADAAHAQKAATAKPAEFSRARGDLGAVASLRTFWDFADMDRATLDLEALRPHLPEEAMKQAIRSYVRAHFAPGSPGAQIRGARIFENTQTSVR